MRIGHLLHYLAQLLHLRGLAPEHVALAAYLVLDLAQLLDLLPAAGEAEGRLEGGDQLGVVEGLDDEVKCPALDGVHGQGYVRIGGEQHHRHIGVGLQYLPEPEKALVARSHLGGEVHVQQDDLRALDLHAVHQVVGRGKKGNFGKICGQQQPQGGEYGLVVIDYEDAAVRGGFLTHIHVFTLQKYKNILQFSKN